MTYDGKYVKYLVLPSFAHWNIIWSIQLSNMGHRVEQTKFMILSRFSYRTKPNSYPKLGKVKLLIFQIMFRRYIQGRTSWFVIITNVNSSQNVHLLFKSLFSPSNSLNVKYIFVRPTPRSLILKLFQTLKHFSRF